MHILYIIHMICASYISFIYVHIYRILSSVIVLKAKCWFNKSASIFASRLLDYFFFKRIWSHSFTIKCNIYHVTANNLSSIEEWPTDFRLTARKKLTRNTKVNVNKLWIKIIYSWLFLKRSHEWQYIKFNDLINI